MRRLCTCLLLCTLSASAENLEKFRPLDDVWPTPNAYRTASGAPGPAYWQQKVDYEIEASLDESTNHITGTEHITYHNNSPDTLAYLWIQLDQNNFDPGVSERPNQRREIRHDGVDSRGARASASANASSR